MAHLRATKLCGIVLIFLSNMQYRLRHPSFVTLAPPVSLRLGHAAGLTVPRTVIQYRVAASLPKIREKANGLVRNPSYFSE